MFFSSEDNKAYKLLKDFYPYHKELEQYTKFTPHYISHKSPFYDANKTEAVPNCLGRGLYCHAARYDLNIQDGKDILVEDIHQKCAYNIAYDKNDPKPNLYWEYMINFYEKCVNSSTINFIPKCSSEVADDIGLGSSKVEQCMLNSFKVDSLKNSLVFTNNNLLLEDDYEIKNKWGVRVFPTLMVNNKTLHNTWSADVLLEAICAGFYKQPKICEEKTGFKRHDSVKKESNDLSYTTIFFIIVIVIGLNIVLIIFCKRYIAQRIAERIENVDINSRINNVVSSYLQLRDQK
jgi:hypothetical protein